MHKTMVNLNNDFDSKGHPDLDKVFRRRKTGCNYAIISTLMMASLVALAGFVGGRYQGNSIAEKNYAKYKAEYNSLKESATRIASGKMNLEREVERLKTTKASREVALALLNKYGYSKIAEEAVLECDCNNNLRLDSNFPSVLCKELNEIVEDARSGYLEHIILHRIEPKETLEGISKKYSLPLRVIENFNNVLFNGYVRFPDQSFSTVKDMTDVRGYGIKSRIIAGKYIAIPVYRQPRPLPPAPPAPENPEEGTSEDK